MRKSFYSMVPHFEGLSNVGIRITKKNGAVVDIGEFKLKNNCIEGKNGKTAMLKDIDYIEIDSD